MKITRLPKGEREKCAQLRWVRDPRTPRERCFRPASFLLHVEHAHIQRPVCLDCLQAYWPQEADEMAAGAVEVEVS